MLSLKFFDEKVKVGKRQPHIRKDTKVKKSDTAKVVFEKFLEAKKKQNLRPQSLNQFIFLFNSIESFHATRSDRPFNLSNITTNFISDYVYWLKHECVKFDGNKYVPNYAKTKGLADASIQSRIKRLKTFINWCLKEERIKVNPFNKFEGFKQNANEIDILTRDEIDNLLKVAKNYSKKSYKHFRDYVLLHLLVDCMFRITEALLIAPTDIDHVNRTIIIRSVNAKSRKARIIPLSNKTYRLIVQLIEENKAFEDQTDDLIFLTLSGRMLSKNNYLRDLKKLAKEAGIKKRFYLHLIRHSVATHYLSASGDIESLRKILGHADYRIVQNYIHMSDDTLIKRHSNHGFFSNENSSTRKRSNKLF